MIVTTAHAVAIVLHATCRSAALCQPVSWFARSIRKIMAMPSPLRRVAIGSRKGSASRARNRIAVCTPNTSTEMPVPRGNTCGLSVRRVPSWTSTMAKIFRPHAATSRSSSRLRTRCGRRSRRTPRGGVRAAVTDSVALLNRSLQSLYDLRGSRQRIGTDGLLDTRPVIAAQARNSRGGLECEPAERDRAKILLPTLVNGDSPVRFTDVITRLSPLVAEHAGNSNDTRGKQDPHQPHAAAAALTPGILLNELIKVFTRIWLKVRLLHRLWPERCECLNESSAANDVVAHAQRDRSRRGADKPRRGQRGRRLTNNHE